MRIIQYLNKQTKVVMHRDGLEMRHRHPIGFDDDVAVKDPNPKTTDTSSHSNKDIS